ncbi:response regulator [Flavobacterium album]|uniref:Response regulator n=1 Tax=Flavobacterium album TaxID=2175091 RepID=A0A2S1QV69_9FLAO|nr:response regulator [Flavobacterium album]AWH84308.1 response regulator [Flavobacterium album]
MSNKRTCFLIDDDEDDREIFSLALGSADNCCSCITVKNGLEALNFINENPDFLPDFIFIDLNMPYMTGKECLEAIKQIPRFANVPAIIYTTSSYTRDAEDARELGAAHFLVKPSSIGALTSALTLILAGTPAVYYLNTATV